MESKQCLFRGWPLVLWLGLVVVLVGCNGAVKAQGVSGTDGATAVERLPARLRAECGKPMVSEVLALANKARVGKKLPEFTCDARLSRAARLHAEDMCKQKYFSHTSQDGRAFHERFRAEDVEFRAAGENIAQGQTTAETVHTGWMNSAGHRKNILNKQFTRLGVGYAPCGGSPYWVQTFAG